ncbi:MAG: MerR family transcriptional regulator [Myxococcales bacterium]|nr:MerR family transcriptional regulator [Myxococcales bacterium]
MNDVLAETDSGGTEEAGYTIDELAAKSGVPSRTIRFYQAKGVLPSPRKRGRVAVYDDSHMERLSVVGQLQDKGLRLRAIRDIVTRKDLDSGAIQQWLGIGERLGALSTDVPKLLSQEELELLLGELPPGLLAQMVRLEAIKPQGEGLARRYLVESPALLQIGARLFRAGIDFEVALGMHDILERRLARAAEEVVDYGIKHVGKGFGRSAEPDAIMPLLETLFSSGAGAEAVQLIFTREVERALQRALQLTEDGTGKRRKRR